MRLVGVTGQLGSGKDTVADYLVEAKGFVKVALADPIKRFGREVFGFTDTQLWGPSEHRNEVDVRFDYYCEVRPGGTRFSPDTKLSKTKHICDPAWWHAALAFQEEAEGWLEEVLPGADVQSLYDWFSVLGNNHARLSPRVMLQHLGTEWGREVANEDIWVNYMIRVAKQVLAGEQYDRRVGLTGVDPSKPKPDGIVVSDVRFHNELTAIKAVDGNIIRITRPKTDAEAGATGITGHVSEMEQKQFQDNDFDAVIVNDATIVDLFQRVDAAIERCKK